MQLANMSFDEKQSIAQLRYLFNVKKRAERGGQNWLAAFDRFGTPTRQMGAHHEQTIDSHFMIFIRQAGKIYAYS